MGLEQLVNRKERRVNLNGFRDRRFLHIPTEGWMIVDERLVEWLEQLGPYRLQNVQEGVAFLVNSKGADRLAGPMLTRTSVIGYHDATGDEQGRWYLAFSDDAAVLNESAGLFGLNYLRKDSEVLQEALKSAAQEGRIVPAPDVEFEMRLDASEMAGDPYVNAILGSYLVERIGPYVQRLPELTGYDSLWTMILPTVGHLEYDFEDPILSHSKDRDSLAQITTLVLNPHEATARSRGEGYVRVTRVAEEDESFEYEDHRGCWRPPRPGDPVSARTILEAFRDCGT